jgi:hypothetical protein
MAGVEAPWTAMGSSPRGRGKGSGGVAGGGMGRGGGAMGAVGEGARTLLGCSILCCYVMFMREKKKAAGRRKNKEK